MEDSRNLRRGNSQHIHALHFLQDDGHAVQETGIFMA
jgi:hypothetical protein